MGHSQKRTIKHEVIKAWVERRHAGPARVHGTTDALRIKFNDDDPLLEAVSWDDWFKIFDEKEFAFVYEEPGYDVKVVARNGREDRAS